MKGLVEVTEDEYVKALDELICSEYNLYSKKYANILIQTGNGIEYLKSLGYDLHYFFDFDSEEYVVIPCETKCFYVNSFEERFLKKEEEEFDYDEW